MNKFKFFKANNKLFAINDIAFIDGEYAEKLVLTVYMDHHLPIEVSGLEAIDLIMATKPSFFEGKRLKFPKNKWILHNMVAHPLMQLLSLIGLRKYGLWLHDVTVPRPIGV